MSYEAFEYLNYASCVMGVLVLVICLFVDDSQMPHRKTMIWFMPALIVFNYITIAWISEKKYGI
jgi:hypothetical protein